MPFQLLEAGNAGVNQKKELSREKHPSKGGLSVVW